MADDEFLWQAVGSLTRETDQPTMLAALAAAHLSRLCIAGQGPLGRKLQELVSFLHPPERVMFLGLRNDVTQLMSGADGFVISSRRSDSPPYAGLEALAVELPVVATRVGGNAELVEDGVSGYLVPPGDAGSLGAAMRRLTLTSEQDRRAMGGRGRAHIVREHDLDQVHHRWRELIDGSAGRSARGRWTLGGAGGRRRWRSPAGLPAADGARGGTPP